MIDQCIVFGLWQGRDDHSLSWELVLGGNKTCTEEKGDTVQKALSCGVSFNMSLSGFNYICTLTELVYTFSPHL